MRIYTGGLCDFMHMRKVPNYHELAQRLTFRAEHPCSSLLNGMTVKRMLCFWASLGENSSVVG